MQAQSKPATDNSGTPRPGSRAERMSTPLARDVLLGLAEKVGVCTRPVVIRRVDERTGESEIVEVPCGARLATKCKPCALRTRRLRMQQIREGWHLTEEPPKPTRVAPAEVQAMMLERAELTVNRSIVERADLEPTERMARLLELDRRIDGVDEWLATHRVRGRLAHPADDKPRTVRSTRRRADAGELPRRHVEHRTIGRRYQARDGREYQPSTLLTVTLPSYGQVHTGARSRHGRLQPCSCGALHGQQDPLLGIPIDPDSYDYRAAACDAVFFAAGLDRFWQNLRRAAGQKLQYAGCVELQRRLAPHAHYAMRGTLERRLLRQVAAATYYQVWWPPFDADHQTYTADRSPVWDQTLHRYVDRDSAQPLSTWEQAIAALDAPESRPGYVLRLGRIDARGITAGSTHADRSIRYVTKYLTKDITDTAKPHSEQQRTHAEQLHAALSVIPCAETCANWLLYNIQPRDAARGLTPGRCSGKVHQPRSLGFTGRRVLISRQWSGKTMADHRADNRAWVHAIITGTITTQPDTAASVQPGRYHYELAHPTDPDVPHLQVRLLAAIAQRQRWRQALRAAQTDPLGRPHAVSATQDPIPVTQAA
jgi:hypothetical protein